MAVGLYKPHKNWDFMLERLAGLWRRGEVARTLVAIGLGRERPAFEERVRRLGVADRVETHGHLSPERLGAEYARARALLFPSLAEGFGLPILEAMGSGTPVLIADRSPMVELAQGAAITFDPDSPETFDAAVRALDRSDTLASQLIARGREVAGRYSWDRTAARIADAVRRCATAG
jgi:alpha-1,3-rhamnosyl/mannosyltransferase